MTKKDNTCVDCGKTIWRSAIRCSSCCRKGQIAWNKGLKGVQIPSKKTRKKMSESQKGNKNAFGNQHTEEWRKQHSESMKGKIHIEETKKKMSEKRKLNWADPKYVAKMSNMLWNTKPELDMCSILDELGISYVRNKRIAELSHPILVDFYLPDFNCVIETDGKYWHNYPVGNDIDHIRTKEMLDAGYQVLRFWENEFDRDSVYDCIKKLRPLINCVVGDDKHD